MRGHTTHTLQVWELLTLLNIPFTRFAEDLQSAMPRDPQHGLPIAIIFAWNKIQSLCIGISTRSTIYKLLSTDQSTQSIKKSTQPIKQSTQSTQSTQPTKQSTQPIKKSTQSTQSTKPKEVASCLCAENQSQNQSQKPNQNVSNQVQIRGIGELREAIRPLLDTIIHECSYKVTTYRGYHVLDNKTKTPLWHKLPQEPDEAYEAFEYYLQNAHYLHAEMSIDQEILAEWSTLYYWEDRVKAYDIYKEASFQYELRRRATRVQDKQFKFADKLFDKLSKRLSDPNTLDMMSTRELLETLRQITKLQRINAGIAAESPLAVDDLQAKPISLEMAINNVNSGSNNNDNNGNPIDQSLLEDPETLMKAQELVIKLTTGK